MIPKPTIIIISGFDPQALTSLTLTARDINLSSDRFRSTGSYEPDHKTVNFSPTAKLSFAPQALTSLTSFSGAGICNRQCFDPQALTSLTMAHIFLPCPFYGFRSTGSYEPDRYPVRADGNRNRFRSTGSYEPDLQPACRNVSFGCFDPQALTSLTKHIPLCKMIPLCFDPQALTSLTSYLHPPDSHNCHVSIHRLLRA